MTKQRCTKFLRAKERDMKALLLMVNISAATTYALNAWMIG
jgi:hypothetical protein